MTQDNKRTLTLEQALCNSYFAQELWRDYLQHKTKENYDKYVEIVGALNK